MYHFSEMYPLKTIVFSQMEYVISEKYIHSNEMYHFREMYHFKTNVSF